MYFKNRREQILVRIWEKSRGLCDRITKNHCFPSKTVLHVARDPLSCYLPFWDLPGLLPAFFQAAFTAHSPVSHRIAYRNPWPLAGPEHQGDDLTPHRVPGGPEKEWRWSGHHGKPKKQRFLCHSV